MNFSKLVCSFNLAKAHTAYLALDDASGVTVKTDPRYQASSEQVCMRLSKILAETLTTEKAPTVANILALKEHITPLSHDYARQTEALLNLCLFKAASQESAPLTSQLTLATEDVPEMTGQEFTQKLMDALREVCNYFDLPTEAKKLLPKRPFDRVRYMTLLYLSNKLGQGRESNILYKLDALFTEVTLQWAEAKAAKKAKNPDLDSKRCRVLLDSPPPNGIQDKHFQALANPRDILYVEKLLLDHVVTHTTTASLIAKKIVALQVVVQRIYYEKPALLVDIEDDQLGLVELGLLLQVKRAALRISRDGVEDSIIALLKKLLYYREEPGYSEVFYELCIDLLKINELLYNMRAIREKTKSLLSVAKTVVDEPKTFIEISYLPRKRLKLLAQTALLLYNELQIPEHYSLKTYIEHEAEASRNLEILRVSFKRFTREDDTALYKQLSDKIAQFRIAAGNTRQLFYKYEQLRFEHHVWSQISVESYNKLLEDIPQKLAMVGLKISVNLWKAEKKEEDRGYDIKLPEYKPQPVRQKKKKSISHETTPRPASPVPVESRSPSPPLPALLPPPPAVAVYERSAPLLYASRVQDWYAQAGSPRDPYIKYAKYRDAGHSDAQKARVRIYHSLALAVDQCLAEAEETTDKAVLKLYEAKRRLQFVVELLKDDSATKGVLTLTIGHSGRVFHRWFTPMESRELINPGVQRGWQVLDEPEDTKEVTDPKDVMSDDGSFIESFTPNSILVADPKNGLKIRIARLH